MHDEEGGDDVDDIVDDKDIWVTINGRKLRMDPADNPSASAFRGMLAQGPVTVHMSHYGGFEIVGPLGADLPRSDSRITTSPGDVILYQGNQVTIYYDENTWSFTMLGHIQGVTQSELKDIIGSGDVDVVFSLEREPMVAAVRIEWQIHRWFHTLLLQTLI